MKSVRRATAIALFLAALAAAQAAASSGLSGTYKTTITGSTPFAGTYWITFAPGKFMVRAPHGIVGRGTDAVSGSKITLHGPGSCTAPGTYRFTRSGSWLTFKRLKDPCLRAAVLTAHSLRKS